MTLYNPDRWIVIEVKENNNEEPIRKVFAGWLDGYLGSDSWKLSSGIIKIKEDEKAFEFINVSGSVYRCHKNAYGMTGWMFSLLESWQERLVDLQDASIVIADEYEPKNINTG